MGNLSIEFGGRYAYRDPDQFWSVPVEFDLAGNDDIGAYLILLCGLLLLIWNLRLREKRALIGWGLLVLGVSLILRRHLSAN